ncbi:hypothetical protein GWI33_013030 [Rhynchophorus ferrugineus]|uniref:Uncharacterized protein n=1 Tax=Rhynchophorus ferrugineus TaxID=354439 RepID=A0A834IHQ6_RHYFE|nr:hypothetical protein GWI33_013030 [Rhynchophorus ferrugineus]
MSRDELQHIRDRLLQLAEASSGQRRPLNVKRKVALSRQTSKTAAAPKLSMQDFVRMDPGYGGCGYVRGIAERIRSDKNHTGIGADDEGAVDVVVAASAGGTSMKEGCYTPDIEHLVFPNPKKRSPQQVAPATLADAPPPPPPPPSNKTRSRLAEMFALSRHLQRSSTERQEAKARTGPQVNRSIDSAIESSNSVTSHARQAAPITDANKRWVYSVDETVRQNFLSRAPSRVSPSNDNNKNGASFEITASAGPTQVSSTSPFPPTHVRPRRTANATLSPTTNRPTGFLVVFHRYLRYAVAYRWSLAAVSFRVKEVDAPGGSVSDQSPVRVSIGRQNDTIELLRNRNARILLFSVNWSDLVGGI